VEEGDRRVSVTNETRRLAWVVLQTANRTQAKGSSVRLVVPRAPEVTYELEPPLSEAELVAVEGYLLEGGYVTRVDIGLRWGTYTISPAGFDWLEGGLPQPTDRLRELAKKPGEEGALESAIRADLKEERHRMEVSWWELERLRLSELEPEGAEPRPGTGELTPRDKLWWRTVTERPWWRFWG
jgi:hypothetical protein